MGCFLGIGNTATTNEEYKVVIKRKMIGNVLVMVLGLCTLGFEIAAQFGDWLSISEYMHGVYTGIGTAFVVISLILLRRGYKTLHNEEKLKKARLEGTDERNLYIQSKSIQYAGIITFFCAYLVMLLAGIYNEIVFHCFYGVVMFFAIVHIIIVKILQKKL